MQAKGPEMVHRPELPTPSVAAPLLSYSRKVVKGSAVMERKQALRWTSVLV